MLDFAEVRCDDLPVTETDQQWPAGAAIQQARGTLSIRAAAQRAGISEARWRHIERGYQIASGRQRLPVNPRPENVVAVARAVGLDPAELFRLMGRDDYPPLMSIPVPDVRPDIVVTIESDDSLTEEERQGATETARAAAEAYVRAVREQARRTGRTAGDDHR